MINLLNSSERRRLQMVEILSQKEDWMTLSTLGQKLSCSVRVLKEDISYFRKHHKNFKIKTSTQGVRLIFDQTQGLKSLYQKLLNDSTAYQLLEIIFFHEDKSIAELSAELFVSPSTLYRMVERVNDAVMDYGFEINTNPSHVTGDEKSIRYFYYAYFTEKYSYLDWPFKTINEEALDKLLNFFVEFTKIPADFAFYNIFKTVASVNLIRYKNNHFVETKDITINFDEIIPNLGAFTDTFHSLEEALETKINTDFINQVFTPYIQDGFSLNAERLLEKAENNKNLNEQMTFLDDILTDISTKNTVPIENKERVIFALQNAGHLEELEPQSGYVLYNRNQYFVTAIQKNFPNFYKHLYTGMKKYRKFINRPVTENGINFFIYTAFIFWENLVPELRKKFEDIRVVIISDRHVSHAHMLKDFIAHEFTEQVVIDIYTSIKLDKEILEDLDYDFVVTNFPIPKLETKPTVYIKNVPNFNDLVKLQQVIDDVIAGHTYH